VKTAKEKEEEEAFENGIQENLNEPKWLANTK